jgi:ABC-2 type transport system ATP-binding protein
MSANAIAVREVDKRFGDVTALTGVDLDVATGEVRGLVGRNGAGKTTLLRLLLGLVRPDRGRIALLGTPVTGGRPDFLDGVAGTVEEPAFYPYLSARRNLELLARLDRRPDETASIDQLLEQVGLASVDGRKVGGFSSGMRQRLALAAALLRSPRLLLLDEPTMGLDPAGLGEFRARVRVLAHRGVTVLLSSHDMTSLEAICDGVTVLSAGTVVWNGSLRELEAQAPPPSFRLATSDDARARALGATRPELVVAPDERGLVVGGRPAVLDDYVLALGRSGIAVRRLEPLVSSLEAAFAHLTGP